jgi:hypothetical protein
MLLVVWKFLIAERDYSSPINPRHCNLRQLMLLLNVFVLTVTSSGPQFTIVVTWNELDLYEHLATIPGIKGPRSVAWLDDRWKVVANKSAWTFS